MFRQRLVRLVFLPILIGLVVTLTAYLYLRREQPAAPPLKLATVVVAKVEVPARTRLAREMVGTRAIPAEYVSPNETTRVEDVIGKVTTVALSPGEDILPSKLAGSDEKTALAYRIPQGKRAMTVKVNEVIGVAGFPESGDHVDILGTFGKDLAGLDKTRVMVEDVLVLAVAHDQPAAAGTKDKKDSRGSSSITLAVSPEEALRVTFAEERGALRLLLRPALPDRNAAELEFNSTAIGGLGGNAPTTTIQPGAPSRR